MSYLLTTYHWPLLSRPRVAGFNCPVTGELGDALFGTRLGEIPTKAERKSGADLFIVDNSDSEWNGLYPYAWTERVRRVWE